MSVIELVGVAANYGATSVLSGIDLRIEAGSVTAILGRNGAGKTTLLNVMLGWMATAEGSVSLDGEALSTMSAEQRGRAIGLVPQNEHIAFEYSILEYVMLGRAPYIKGVGGPTDGDVVACNAALTRVGLEAMIDKGVLETSAGERQLVLLARALAQNPNVLLMDEPTAHLDIHNRRSVANLIRSDASMGRTIILTAHEPDFVAEVADTVILLSAGTIRAAGKPEETLTGELLSDIYGADVQTKEVAGRRVFLW